MDGQSGRADRTSEGKGDSQKRAMPRQRRLTEKELPCASRWLGLMSSAAIKVRGSERVQQSRKAMQRPCRDRARGICSAPGAKPLDRGAARHALWRSRMARNRKGSAVGVVFSRRSPLL